MAAKKTTLYIVTRDGEDTCIRWKTLRAAKSWAEGYADGWPEHEWGVRKAEVVADEVSGH